jgi:hypothetical protein
MAQQLQDLTTAFKVTRGGNGKDPSAGAEAEEPRDGMADIGVAEKLEAAPAPREPAPSPRSA